MVDRVYHAGASMLGLIWSSFAVGSLVGTLLWSHFRPTWGLRPVLAGVVIGWGLFSGLAGSTTQPWQAMVTLFCGGLVYSPYNIVAVTWQQRLIPDHLRGSVFGMFQSVTSSGLPFGQLVGGLLVSSRGCRCDDDHWRRVHGTAWTRHRLASRSLEAGAAHIRASLATGSTISPGHRKPPLLMAETSGAETPTGSPQSFLSTETGLRLLNKSGTIGNP